MALLLLHAAFRLGPHALLPAGRLPAAGGSSGGVQRRGSAGLAEETRLALLERRLAAAEAAAERASEELLAACRRAEAAAADASRCRRLESDLQVRLAAPARLRVAARDEGHVLSGTRLVAGLQAPAKAIRPGSVCFLSSNAQCACMNRHVQQGAWQGGRCMHAPRRGLTADLRGCRRRKRGMRWRWSCWASATRQWKSWRTP